MSFSLFEPKSFTWTSSYGFRSGILELFGTESAAAAMDAKFEETEILFNPS
jgi:hypothetical protein